MEGLVWFLLPGFTAVASALLAWFVMQSRMEVALAREREKLAETRGALEAQKEAMGDALTGASESARRHAMDEFLADLRIEQRHYTRENKLLFQNRRSLVLQERLFFRNLPISEWIEHEVLLEEGADVQKVAETVSSFDRGVLSIEDVRAKRAALPSG
jgi:hypothetical protein